MDSRIGNIADTLKAFTSNQLIAVINKLITKHPDLEQVSAFTPIHYVFQFYRS